MWISNVMYGLFMNLKFCMKQHLCKKESCAITYNHNTCESNFCKYIFHSNPDVTFSFFLCVSNVTFEFVMYTWTILMRALVVYADPTFLQNYKEDFLLIEFWISQKCVV